MSYKEWLEWREEYFKNKKHSYITAKKPMDKKKMTKKNWKDLFIGFSMIGLSTWLFINGQYTLEIAILLGLLTLWWLEFF
tara:strand:- start:260 stop:499 length:240 start_codon:yes stop_codon:yes gene_type:complete